jgi:hypothetical protein
LVAVNNTAHFFRSFPSANNKACRLQSCGIVTMVDRSTTLQYRILIFWGGVDQVESEWVLDLVAAAAADT